MANRPRKAQSPVDRLPPHSAEAEQAILGSILLDPNSIIHAINGLSDTEVFYDLRHREIFKALVELFDQGVPIDTVTLVNQLRMASQLEGVGGAPYLSELPNAVSSASNIGTYIGICQDKHTLRKLIMVATETVQRAYEEAVPVDQQLDIAEAGIMQIANRTESREAQNAKAMVNAALRRIGEREARGPVDGIPSGFDDLDALCGGFHPDEMVIIAARPSVGKSTFLLNVADNVAVGQKIPVGIISMEMPSDRMMERMLASRARVNLKTISAQNPRDIERIKEAANVLRKAPIYIDYERGLTLMRLRSKARRLKSDHGIGLLGIDYIQLLSCGGDYMKRHEEVSAISKGIYDLAAELGIPIIGLSQLSRDLEKEKVRVPRLSDLRESGSLEQDADTVVMLWNQGADDAGPEGGGVRVGVQVGKQRYGPPGRFDLLFLKSFTRFESVARVDVQPEML